MEKVPPLERLSKAIEEALSGLGRALAYFDRESRRSTEISHAQMKKVLTYALNYANNWYEFRLIICSLRCP